MKATPVRVGLPRELIRASRAIGLAHGASTFAAAALIGSITSRIATSLGVHNGTITAANTAGGACGTVLAVLIIVTRRGVPRRTVTVAIFTAAAVGACLVAVAGLPFAPRGIAWVYGGLCLLSLALVSLTPIRPAVAARFAAEKLDGTFTSRSRAWSYGSIGTLALVVGGVAVSPLGWRVATAILAIWLFSCGLMLLFFRQYPNPTKPEDRLDPWELWRLIRAGEQRRMVVAVGATAFTAQLVYVSFEPFLSGADRLGGRAPLAVGIGLAGVKLALVPLIFRQGDLADDRVRRSAQRAARYLAAAAPVTALALVVEPLPALLAVLLVASVLVELGNGPMGDAARTYGSRLGIEADAMTTVAQQVCYGLAGLVATLAQLPGVLTEFQRLVMAVARPLSHPSSFGVVVVVMLAATSLAASKTHRSEWRDEPRGRCASSHGPAARRRSPPTICSPGSATLRPTSRRPMTGGASSSTQSCPEAPRTRACRRWSSGSEPGTCARYGAPAGTCFHSPSCRRSGSGRATALSLSRSAPAGGSGWADPGHGSSIAARWCCGRPS
jgi:hypothetical protein